MAGLVKAVHLHERYPIHEVDLDLSPFTVIVGKNDSGKSTLLECIADVLAMTPPSVERPGWWVPSAAGEQLIRATVALPAGPLRVTNPQRGRSFVVGSGEVEVECDLELALSMMRPAGDVVWLRLDSSFREADEAVRNFLAAVVADSLDSGWVETPGDLEDSEDLRHLVRPDGGPRPWVVDVLSRLSRRAFRLLPEFAVSEYEGLLVEAADDPVNGFGVFVTLHAGRGDCPYPELATGIRSWVNLSIGEAARRILRADPSIDGDVVRVAPDTPTSTLYLVDEPERHLHPQAAHAAAHWLYELMAAAPSSTSVVVATHSPVFLDLHRRGDVGLVICVREDLPGDHLDFSVSTVREWRTDQVDDIRSLATAAGLDLADAFLTGTLPVIVEGRYDAEYFRHIWPFLSGGIQAESLGIRFFLAGGLPSVKSLLDELIEQLYPAATPVVLITDAPDLDYPANGDGILQLAREHPRLRIISHDAFDVWGLIPERVLDSFGARRTSATWQSVSDRRRSIIGRQANRSTPSPRLPGKADVLTAKGANQWAEVLGSVSADDVPPTARQVVDRVNSMARRAR